MRAADAQRSTASFISTESSKGVPISDESSVEIAQCPHCSASIMSDYRFHRCPKCGKKLPPEITALVESYPQGQRSSLTTKTGSSAASSESRQIQSLTQRYRDAYLVSTVTNGFGKLIKGVGVVVAALLALFGLFVLGQGRPGEASFALGVVVIAFGIISGLGFYILGVLVSANAQVLKATLDGAVNTSPFLTNEHRVKIMTLPQS